MNLMKNLFRNDFFLFRQIKIIKNGKRSDTAISEISAIFYYLREKQGFLDEDGPRGKQDTAFQSENWRAFLSSCLSTPPHISFLS